jgi:SAM-dependent methyltransferase
MKSLEKVLIHHRRELLSHTQGTVLEVGAGTGVNFSLYPPDVQVFAIEPSKPMYKKALQQAAGKSNIRVFNIGIEQVAQFSEIPKQFDYITSMLVMCTITDPDNAAEIYKKHLHPDGKLLVLEHIHSTGKFYGLIQNIINPVWRPLADGCNLTRRQDVILKQKGFIPECEKYFTLGTDWYQAVMHY